MFQPIRRKDRILDDVRAMELLEAGEYGFLSAGVGENGYAYGVPLNFVYDKRSNAIYFHCAPEGHKLDVLKQHNKVSFCVVGYTEPIPNKFSTYYESVIVFGTADLQLSDEEKTEALRLIIQKYSPEFVEIGEKYMKNSFHRTFVFKLSVDHITAKSKPR